ncbi:TonB-dependent outer membrane receptor, SusC/RagA subfamily, signature region [bacterium A37T11]|nr:TonB-dependent outer membrane receptor, SusC/RagA subfamily, signature region [bacterium A37T11]
MNKYLKCGPYTWVLLLTASLILQIRVSQAQQVTLDVSHAKLETVIRQLRQQSYYDFIYNPTLLDTVSLVTVSVKNKPLKEVLDLIFASQPLEYAINKNTVMIRAKGRTKKVKEDVTGIKRENITGVVVDSTGNPLPNVTVRVKGGNQATITDRFGKFTFNTSQNPILTFTLLGYQAYETIAITSNLTVILQISKETISEVEVVSTGYQQIPKERVTGSFDHIDNELFNRRVSTNILDKIENLTPGILFNHGDAAATDEILIRGRSTIYAKASPLIVLDNFPYDGDIRNINPNDISEVTVLKDAAAASIWGAQSGNGVIVITTKKGKSNRPTIELNTNTTLIAKPDLKNISTISSANYIELEKYLFGQRYYDTDVSNIYKPALTPVVELLYVKEAGTIDPGEADRQIEQMKGHDVRDDYSKYLYQYFVKI